MITVITLVLTAVVLGAIALESLKQQAFQADAIPVRISEKQDFR